MDEVILADILPFRSVEESRYCNCNVEKLLIYLPNSTRI